MNKTANIQGIRIRTVNIIMLCLSLLLFLIVLYTTVRLTREYDSTLRAIDTYLNWEKAAHSIHVASDYLTEQARLYTQTGNRVYMDNFVNELQKKRTRENALLSLEKKNMLPTGDYTLQKALELSNGLSFSELYAMRLMADAKGEDADGLPEIMRSTLLSSSDLARTPEQKMNKAREMMYSRSYQGKKKDILDMLTKFLDKNLRATRENMEVETNRLGSVVRQQRLVLIALCLLNVLTFAMIIILIVKPLQVYLKCIRDDKMIELVGAYEFKHLALTYNDIFALKEHHDKMLKYRAEHDPLTGLLNRSAYNSLQALLKQDPNPVGLLLIDVDKFKDVNDTYGHAVGDKALWKVGSMLQHSFRSGDFCIRLGGDEFVVLMQGTSPDMEEIVRKKIEQINMALLHPNDDVPPLSLSVGGAISPAGFTDELYNEADAALYQVKEAGRCGCAFYHDNSARPDRRKPQEKNAQA